ncbi:MAG: hypothetical protein ACJAZ1_001426 [Yoonia sp.]|jgi:hypothetical protein
MLQLKFQSSQSQALQAATGQHPLAHSGPEDQASELIEAALHAFQHFDPIWPVPPLDRLAPLI